MNVGGTWAGHLIYPLSFLTQGLWAEGTRKVRQQTGTNHILTWVPEGSHLCSLMVDISPWPQGLCHFASFTSQRSNCAYGPWLFKLEPEASSLTLYSQPKER